MRKVMWSIALVLLAAAGLLMWQAQIAIDGAQAERAKRLEQWVGMDRERAVLVEEYRNVCEAWGPQRATNERAPTAKPPTYGDCLLSVAADRQSPVPPELLAALAESLDTAPDAVKLPVPLRWM